VCVWSCTASHGCPIPIPHPGLTVRCCLAHTALSFDSLMIISITMSVLPLRVVLTIHTQIPLSKRTTSRLSRKSSSWRSHFIPNQSSLCDLSPPPLHQWSGLGQGGDEGWVPMTSGWPADSPCPRRRRKFVYWNPNGRSSMISCVSIIIHYGARGYFNLNLQ